MPVKLIRKDDLVLVRETLPYHSLWFFVELILEFLADARACRHVGEIIYDFS
jgi:hypothetical protein